MNKKILQLFKFKQFRFILLLLTVIFFNQIPPVSYGQQTISEDLFSISFANKNQGWACGRMGTILHTDDGGGEWKSQNSSTDVTLSAIHFIDVQTGWAVGDDGVILHTRNGGGKWEKQVSPVRFFLMDVTFSTPRNGWIVTEQTHILKTDDGGRTWHIQFTDSDFILKSISFFDETHGWAVGEYGFIYHTRDGGATWQRQGGYFGFSESTGDMEGGTYLFDVVAIDPLRAWAVGIDGYVIKTEDGGKLWEVVATGAPRTQLFCVESDNGGTIMIGGEGVVLSSSDNGGAWKVNVFQPSIDYGWIYDLAQLNASNFIAVGWEGAIYKKELGVWEKFK